MANEIILVDTSILIDFYRKTDKANSVWISLIRKGYKFSISVVTKYEIYSGAVRSVSVLGQCTAGNFSYSF